MGLFDKLTGTKRPDEGIPPLPAEEVRAALLALNAPEVPYAVRDARTEGADLLAEWRVTEPSWYGFFSRTDVRHVLRFRLRLVPEKHEVRVVQEQLQITWVRGVPTLSASAEAGRGPGRTVSKQWTLGRNAQGHVEATETFSYDTADLRDPLRRAVLESGWTWRGVILGKL
ncbi:hypothetical protein ABZ930_05990 [Streptomyces sp. NPDC046716]|uniref:hypothetical protein n=1 Tax=Streptomyces sp. NPDC046716 TaxID=3157093 RepID=UPI0033DFC09E